MIKNRAFLKWAGGKYHLIDAIRRHLPDGDLLIEPFIGAGSVFLNTDYPRYLLTDINADLIYLYQLLKDNPERFIDDAKHLFSTETNDADCYYQLRQEFNLSQDPYHRSLLFLYLNRHGYNGLCRYNKSGGFNVPFGRYKKPYFPASELEYFAQKAKQAEFVCCSYEQTFDRVQTGDVVYCDPPYAPLTATASFTSYTSGGFNEGQQLHLAQLAELVSHQRGATVLISNHEIAFTRKIYSAAQLSSLKVRRTISRKGQKRVKVDELLALYPAQPRTDSVAYLVESAKLR
ncbi:Dam family site-specific DNA-(adenine-N6)-methyltransferase [Celerinatantimonas sp. YJH-8]|uniref:Dam family site-specific DNA-(adenine-N6)-methyltransferase n=1 Tax=Celerinatantimonas sp. YJH-8 TaxID=3228714 RepID=UPI0038C9484D